MFCLPSLLVTRSRGEAGTAVVTVVVTAAGFTPGAGAVVTWVAWAECTGAADGVAEVAGERRELRCIPSGEVAGVGAAAYRSGSGSAAP